MFIGKAGSHAARRVSRRPWEADKYLRFIFDMLVSGNDSLYALVEISLEFLSWLEDIATCDAGSDIGRRIKRSHWPDFVSTRRNGSSPSGTFSSRSRTACCWANPLQAAWEPEAAQANLIITQTVEECCQRRARFCSSILGIAYCTNRRCCNQSFRSSLQGWLRISSARVYWQQTHTHDRCCGSCARVG